LVRRNRAEIPQWSGCVVCYSGGGI
jgi:hypothetical protein